MTIATHWTTGKSADEGSSSNYIRLLSQVDKCHLEYIMHYLLLHIIVLYIN